MNGHNEEQTGHGDQEASQMDGQTFFDRGLTQQRTAMVTCTHKDSSNVNRWTGGDGR